MHESWTVANGLPVNSVNALLQSQDGYIWIATFDGLVRFDGVRFTVFNSSNSPELPSNRITDLWETRDGALWLRTEQMQLVRFRGGVFTHFERARGVAQGVSTLHEDSRGKVWVGTNAGLGIIAGERFVPVAADTIRGRQVVAICDRRDGSIWAALAGGQLVRIEGEVVTQVVRDPGLAGETILALYEDPQGTLWIGTSKGIWRYGQALERFLPREAYGFQTSPRTGELWTVASGEVRRMGAHSLDLVVMSTPGLYRPHRLIADGEGRMLYSADAELHREGERIYALPPNAAGRRGPLQTITAILPDREGSIWLGTFGAGLHRLKPALFSVFSEAEGLSGRNAYSVYEDRAGTLWVGTFAGGTFRMAGGRITRLREEAGFPPRVLSFLEDRNGRLWLGSASGVRVCAPPFTRCVPVATDAIGTAGIHAMYEEPGGTLWVGASTGLFRNESGERWQRLDADDGAPSFPVRVFLPTRDGALWMGTNGGGLARYAGGRFTRVSTADGLPLDLIRSLHQDADGWLWVGTEGRGLVRLDPREWDGREGRDGRRERIVSYRTSDGLFDDVIHQILEDDFGRLWMSTNRGIFWVDRRQLLDFAEGKLSRINSTGYTERDGLRNREANGGSQPAGIKSRDGRLWFPTQDGVAVVNPAHVQQNRLAPSVVVERITAGGTSLQPNDSVLALGVEQRDLEIEYTALSFLAPANVRFRYRLEPYDRDWVEAGGRRTAYYTRVPPGRYTFRVIASNNDGVWNEEGAALALQLEPYLWETGAFRALAALALGLLAVGAVGWRIRNLRARTRELARVVEERTAELRARERQLQAQNTQLEVQAEQLQELDRAKSHFFANVSHEFRTPLTLILGPLRDIGEGRRGVLPAWVQEQIEPMTRNAQRLLRLVNQVLDLAKLESHALTLALEPRDLAELARAATLSFTPLAERRGVALRLLAPTHPLPVEVDVEQIEKVLLNLLSNAFKFTESGGAVEVSLRAEAGKAVLAVRDTGIGIAAEQLPHVFERFFQADSSATRRHEGTGIGLSLVRELVELHGGSVSAESELGVGSTFTVRLPLSPKVSLQDEGMPRDAAAHRIVESAGSGDVATLSSEGAAPEGLVAEPPDADDRTTVLVVDDNTDVRAYVRSVLEPTYRVLEAADGQAGLERARESLPDLVLADVMMPRLDGFALARALREDSATDCIPIILLTARAGEEDEIEGLGTGADDYLGKPFHAGVLEARVGALISSRRRLRERFRQEGVPDAATAAASDTARQPSALEKRLREIIAANLTDPDFNPEALAAAAGMSYQQLYRHLAAELGAAPSHFLRGVRVEHAARLLREGAGSVTEIAYSVGFNSLSYFHRCYRERFGSTPMASVRAQG